MMREENEYIIKSKEIEDSLRQLCKTSFELFLKEYNSGHILQKSRFDKTPVLLSKYGEVIDELESCPDYGGFMSSIIEIVRKSPESRVFEKALRDDEKARRHLDHGVAILNTSKPDTVYEYIWKFVGWLVIECNGFAFSDAIFDRIYPTFEEYLYSDEIPYIAFAAIWHLNTNVSEIILNDDVRISRIADSRLKKYLVKELLPFSPIPIEPRYRYVLEVSGTTSKLFSKGPKILHLPGTRNIEQKLSRIITIMRIFKLGDVKLTYLGAIPLGWVYDDRQLISSRIGDPPLYNIPYDLADSDIPNLIDFHKKLESLPSTGPIEVAFRNFDSSYSRDTFEDRLVDYVTSFEALLLKEESELQFRLALRTAALVGKNPEERERIFNQMRKAYRIRSAIVHGADSKRIVSELEGIKLHNFMFQFQETLRWAFKQYFCVYNEGKNKDTIINDLDCQIIRGFEKQKNSFQ